MRKDQVLHRAQEISMIYIPYLDYLEKEASVMHSCRIVLSALSQE